MPDLIATVRFGPRALSRPARVWTGSTARVWIEVRDADTRALYAATGVALAATKPGGAIVSWTSGNLTASGTGLWYVDVSPATLNELGDYAFTATVSSPQAESAAALLRVLAAGDTSTGAGGTSSSSALATAAAASAAAAAASAAQALALVPYLEDPSWSGGWRLEKFAPGGVVPRDFDGDLDSIFAAGMTGAMTDRVPLLVTPGNYRFAAPILIPDDAADLIVLMSDFARMERRFSTTGSSGFVRNTNQTSAAAGTARPKRIRFIGGDWGSPHTPGADGMATAVTYNGNIFALYADDSDFIFSANGLGTGARFFIGGGEGLRISPRNGWRQALKAAGSAGVRITGGGVTRPILVFDGEIQCGDDALQPVQAESGPFANQQIGHVIFRNLWGRAWDARFMAVTMTDQNAGSQATYTASTRRVDYIGCNGSGYGFAAFFQNADSTGQIGEINLIDCELRDDSPIDSISTPAAISVDGGGPLAGRNGAPGIGAVRVIRTTVRAPQKIAMRVTGEVGEVLLQDHLFGAPKQLDGPHVQIRRAETVTVERGKVYPGQGQNGYQFGSTVNADDWVDELLVDGARVLDMPELGDGSFSYGFAHVKVRSGLHVNRSRVEPRAGSAFVRYASVNAESSSVRFESADLRALTAALPILDGADDTQYGDDLMIAGGGAYDDLFQTVSVANGGISGSAILWDGRSRLIRVQLTADTTINTITPAITPNRVISVAIVPVTSAWTLTVSAATGVGNVHMPANATVPFKGMLVPWWDPANGYFRAED